MNEKYWKQTLAIARWETDNLYWSVSDLIILAVLLQKEPLHIPTRVVKPIEYNRRTYVDLRHELEVKLVSLPRYQAICTIVGGEQAVQVKTPAPYKIPADTKPKADNIRRQCREQIGKPWAQVLATGKKQHRTIPKANLPPAKPHY